MHESRRARLMVSSLLAAGLLAAVFLATAALRADGRREAPAIAGTWAFSTSLATVGMPGATLAGMVTFNEDGTLVYDDALMFGGGAQLFPWKTSPYHGVWRATGRNRFGGTSIAMLFDPATGAMVGFVRARSSLRFASGDSKIVGTIFTETVICPNSFSCPDPANPGVQWTPFGNPVDGFPVVLTRVVRVPAGPLQ